MWLLSLAPAPPPPPPNSSSNDFPIQSGDGVYMGASSLIRLQGGVRFGTATMEGARKEAHSKMVRWTKWCLFPWQLSASGSETSSPTSSVTNMTFEMMKKGFLKVFVFWVRVLFSRGGYWLKDLFDLLHKVVIPIRTWFFHASSFSSTKHHKQLLLFLLSSWRCIHLISQIRKY